MINDLIKKQPKETIIIIYNINYAPFGFFLLFLSFTQFFEKKTNFTGFDIGKLYGLY